MPIMLISPTPPISPISPILPIITNNKKNFKMSNTFLPQNKNYRTLKAYQKAECIYDITYYFAHTFLKSGDRTIDQMI